MDQCSEHSGHEARLLNLEHNDKEKWKEINAMKKWVIAGMSAFIIQLIIVIISGLYLYVK